MAYDDRDYFQSKPKFEFASGLPDGTKGLMIAVIAAYVAAIVISNYTGFIDEDFWRSFTAGNEQAVNAYNIFLLIPQNVIPAHGMFDPQPWKILTHWLFPPGILSAVLDVLMIYFAGRLVEPLFGTKRYLLMFLGFCVLSGALASLLDPWIVGSERVAVIMGPTGGIFGVFLTMLWIAPEQKSFLNLKVKHVVLGFLGIFGLITILTGVFGSGPAAMSPTQLLFGAGVSALYMTWLKKRGRVPSFAGGFQASEKKEPWEEEGYMHGYKEGPSDEAKFNKAAEKQRKEEEKRRKQGKADQEKLDAILDKISKEGMTALTRAEKKFLDKQSNNKKKR